MHEGWTTLSEVETHYSFEDVIMANETLDAIRVAESKANKK